MSKSAAPAEMSDFTRRTLRLWAVFEGIYGVMLLLTVLTLIPWKSTTWNTALIAYAVLHVLAAPGLWRARRWGWRVSLIGGLIGLLLFIAVTAGLLASWAYLRGIYGDFGRGASIGALLFASIALQVLGLYPALLLRALLRRDVRADMGASRHWLKAIVGLCLMPLAACLWVGAHFGMSELEAVSLEGRQQATVYLRAAIDGTSQPPLDALEGIPVGEGPLFVTLWDLGEPVLRLTGDGDDLADAVRSVADQLAVYRDRGDALLLGRLKVDRIIGAAPVLGIAPLAVALSVDPGRDGLRRGARSVLPDDLVYEQRFGAAPLVPGIHELRLGMHVDPVLATLDHTEHDPSELDLVRFRTESWIEHDRGVLPVTRNNTPTPGVGPEAWRQAAIAGGDFILRQLLDDGRFHYQYFPISGEHPNIAWSGYSIPRHAGTVYALALLYGHTQLPRFRIGAERAIEWLGANIPPSCGTPERGCVVDDQWASLGGSALAMVGMLEYQRRTDDARYEPIIRRLGEFVLMMQKDDGNFFHMYDPQADQLDESVLSMFYSEEAALALVTAFKVLGDERYLEAARRALDYLTGPKYEPFFLGRFIYGADHWTCIAAEEAWPHLQSPTYLDFCRGYSRFIGRLQFAPDTPQPGFEGHYGFTPLMVPQAPATAGFSEAIISSWALSVHHGQSDEELGQQAAAGLDALVRDQIRSENAWMMRDPQDANGGIRRSIVEDEVRIDFTQHAASALIRGAEMP